MPTLPTWPPDRLAPVYRVEPVAFEQTATDEQETAYLHFNDWLDRPVAVFAMRRRPLSGDAHAGVLHCVGGAQTVHPRDLAFWNEAGFAAASFDWQIAGVSGRPPERSTRFPAEAVAQFHPTPRLEAAVLPIALQAAAVCLDWLAHTPGIDPRRLGVSGISWGGYLTWLLACYRPVRAIVTAFGCGGLFLPGRPHPAHAPEVTAFWKQHWDPLSLGPRIEAAACHLNGTNDFFGDPLVAETLLTSLAGPKVRHLLPNVDHSLDAAQSRLALAWMNHHLRDGPPLPETPRLRPDLSLAADVRYPSLRYELWWSDSPGPATMRCWQCTPPPRDRPLLAFARVTYEDGIELCTPLQSFAPEPGLSAPPRPAPVTIPFGLGWRWEVGHARLFDNNAHARPPVAPDGAWTLTPARPESPAPVCVLLHPEAGALEGLASSDALALEWSTTSSAETTVMLHLRTHPDAPIEARADWQGRTLLIEASAFAPMPDDFAWSQVGRIQILTTLASRAPFSVGPLRILTQQSP